MKTNILLKIVYILFIISLASIVAIAFVPLNNIQMINTMGIFGGIILGLFSVMQNLEDRIVIRVNDDN